MQYRSHILTSTTLAYGLAKMLHLPFSIGYYGGVLLGCLLPDIDEPNSYVGRRSLGLAKIIKKHWGHRGLTHSITFILLTTIGFIVTPSSFTAGISLGYALHILEDFFSKSGVPLLAPFNKKKYRSPIYYRTGKVSEGVAVILVGILFTILILTT